MSVKKSVKNLIFITIILCLMCPLGGCGNSKNDFYMELSETENGNVETPVVSETVESVDTVDNDSIYVYVCGAVQNPGVYELDAGSRLYEAVDLAGGITDEADGTYLNMARLLSDGEQVVVYTVEEAESIKEEEAVAVVKVEEAKSGLININTADINELTTLSGIGESRAKAIIDYREKNGAFNSIEDIKNVDGIKDGLFSKIKDNITI
jgi:competence protein ComEA